jgi:peptidoglycan/xylan/chitin deacetylase (PgdA/CDA1 family)
VNAANTSTLTFDDGPDPVWTPRVLDCLRREGARCTFFVLAGRARAHPRHTDLELVGWSIDTEDWRGDCAASMHARVQAGLGTGSVVLMHDGIGPGARCTGCRAAVALIPRLVETLAHRGLRPVPLSENAG